MTHDSQLVSEEKKLVLNQRKRIRSVDLANIW